MWRQFAPAFRMALAMTVLTGFVYPGVVTALCQLLFYDKANGSLVRVEGRVVGSSLIGQKFTKPEYFHPRPSAAGNDGYEASASCGSNYGPTNQKLVDRVKDSIEKFRQENPDYHGEIPSDVDRLLREAEGIDVRVFPR